MASVVGCPKCSHELLILNDADAEYWAKCPACSIFFQVKDAPQKEAVPTRRSSIFDSPSNLETASESLEMPAHELPSLAPSPTPTVAYSSLQTLADIAALEGNNQFTIHDAASSDVSEKQAVSESASADATSKTDESPKHSVGTVGGLGQTPTVTWEGTLPELPVAAESAKLSALSSAAESQQEAVPSADRVEAATDPQRESFHSAKTVVNILTLPTNASAATRPVGNGNAKTAPTTNGTKAPASTTAAARNPADIRDEPSLRGTVDPAAWPLAKGLDSSPPAQVGPGESIEVSDDPLDDSNDADFELEDLAEQSASSATWDDPEQMDRLLAGNGEEPSEDQLAETAPSAEPVLSPKLFAQLTRQRHRRQPSAVRTLVGVVSAGVIGSAIGYYILLWILGADGDFLNVAQYLPSAILPGSVATSTPELAASPKPVPHTVSKEPVPGGDSAVEQARFEAPLTEDVSQLAELSTFASSEATPNAETNVPHVPDARFYTADQVEAALQLAKSARAGLVAGDLQDGAAVRRTKGASYQQLCGLAEKATFADAASRSSSVGSWKQQVDDFFRETLSDERTRSEVARIVPIWTAYKNRQSNGVFFAGTVRDHTTRGEVVECRIDVGAGDSITILVPEALAAPLEESARPLAIVGSIVDDPAEHLSGYDGDAAQVVWVGRLIRLE